MGNNKYGVQLCEADSVEIEFEFVDGAWGCCYATFHFFGGNYSRGIPLDYETALSLSDTLNDIDGWWFDGLDSDSFDDNDIQDGIYTEYWNYGA